MAAFFIIPIILIIIIIAMSKDSSRSNTTPSARTRNGVPQKEVHFSHISLVGSEYPQPITGISYRNIQPSDVGFSANCYLKREKDNPKNANAIAVYKGNKHIGYIPDENLYEFYPEFHTLDTIACRGYIGVAKINDGEYSYYGKVLIDKENIAKLHKDRKQEVSVSDIARGYEKVISIASEYISRERLSKRDTKYNFSVIADEDPKKYICKLHLNNPDYKRIVIDNAEGVKQSYDLKDVSDIKIYKLQLIERIKQLNLIEN